MSEIGRVGDPELELEQLLRRIDPAVAEAAGPAASFVERTAAWA